MLHRSCRAGVGAGLVCALVIAGAASAAPGDVVVRVGAAHVAPNDDSGELSGVPGASVAVDDTTSLGVTLTWMMTGRLGVGLLAAWPFAHDVRGRGPALNGAGRIAEVRHLPPTLTLQYHFAPDARLRPWVGAGVNYTHFFDEKTVGAIEGVDIEVEASWGWALEAGVDYALGADWYLSGQAWYIAMDTEVTLGSELGRLALDIDPWVFMVGAGRRF